MKFLFILLVIITMPFQVKAMGERPEVDADCFASDLLRVEIGGEKFAFPRKMVHEIRGKDVININEKSNTYGSGSKACQKASDGAWNIDYVSLNIFPLPCESRRECSPTEIYTKLYSEQAIAQTSIIEYNPTTPEKLIQKCTPLQNPMNETHAKNGELCSFVFKHDSYFLFIEFKNGSYPAEKIENTKQLVLDEIYKHKIK